MTGDRPGSCAADVVRRWLEARRLDGLTALDRLVLFDLAERAGSTGRSWEGATTIARRNGYHAQTIRRSFSRIAATGIATRERPPGRPAKWSFRHHPEVVAWCDWSPDVVHTPAPMGAHSTGLDPAPMGAHPAPMARATRADGRA